MEADSYVIDGDPMGVAADINIDLDEIFNPKFNSGDTQPSADKATDYLSDELREIGSSCASITPASKQAKTSAQNVTPSTCAHGELWDIQRDSALNQEQPAEQSSSNFPLTSRPQMENQTSAEADNQPQLDKMVPNKNPSGNVNTMGGLSAANESSMSPLNMATLFPNSPLHFQTREHLEPGLLSPGYGMYFTNHANFGQSPVQSAFQNFYPVNDNLSNIGLPRPSSFNQPGPSTEPANPSTTVEMILNNQVQPFPSDRGVNWENRNLFKAQSQNTSRMPYQVDPLGVNVSNNNMMISNVQLAGPQFPTLVPQTSATQMEALNGQSSWINQQNPNGPFLNSGAPMPSSLPRPQHPQYSQSMEAEAFNLQFSNPTLPGTSTLRPPSLINNRSQLHSGVSGMPGFYSITPYDYSMIPGPSTHPRPQNFSGPLDIAPRVPDIYDRQGYNSMVPNQSSQFARPLQFPNHQVPGNPDAQNSQYYNSMLPNSSMPSRSQIPNSGYLPSGMPDLQNPNATNTPDLFWLSGARASGSTSGLEAFQQFNAETTQGIPSQTGRRRSRFEIGDSSSKRFRGESSNAEEDPTALGLRQSDRTANPNPPAPRILKNTVYDPMFEKIGLPVDPHIRMFSLLQ